MTPDVGGRDAHSVRRLTLTPIGFDIVLALAQVPDGMRLSALAAAIGSPVSSVQAALRILLANGLAERVGDAPPHYRLADRHPAHAHLVDLAVVLPDADHALAVILRASPAIEVAVVDAAGFIASVRDDARPEDRERLRRMLDQVAGARRDTPPIELDEHESLTRLLGVSLGLRARMREAITLKGRIPRTVRSPAPPPEPTETGQLVL